MSGLPLAVSAQVLNVWTGTLQSWEQGQRKPSQAVLRFSQVFRHDPSGTLKLVGMSARIVKVGVAMPDVVDRNASR